MTIKEVQVWEDGAGKWHRTVKAAEEANTRHNKVAAWVELYYYEGMYPKDLVTVLLERGSEMKLSKEVTNNNDTDT